MHMYTLEAKMLMLQLPGTRN